MESRDKRIAAVIVIIVCMALYLIATSKGVSKSSAVASWYGPGLYGNILACGGRLHSSTWGVANKTMRCGTKLTICLGKRCAAVSVIDRGPWVPGRDFDLTAAVASYIGLHGVQTITWERR